jgi:hypothetical protein
MKKIIRRAVRLLFLSSLPRPLSVDSPAEDEVAQSAYDSESAALHARAHRLLRARGLIDDTEYAYVSRTVSGAIDVWGPAQGSDGGRHEFRRTVTEGQ